VIRIVNFAFLWFALCSISFSATANEKDITRYIVDGSGALSIGEILSMPSYGWQPIDEESVSFGYDTRTYWLQMEIAAGDSERLLQVAYPLLDHLEIYFVQDKNVIAHYELGDHLPFSARPIAHEDFVVHIPAEKNVTAFLRVQTGSSLNVPVKIWQEKEFYSTQAHVQLGFGIYFGVLLCMVLYNLFGFVVIRESNVFSYSIYVVFVGLMVASLTGVGFRHLWPDNIWLQERSLVLFGSMSFTFASIFISQLLKIKQYSVFFVRGLWLLGTVSALIAFSSILLPYSTSIKLLLVYAPLSCAFIFVLAIRMWRRGGVYARIFAAAWATFLVAIFLNSLAYLGVIDAHFMQRYAIMIGSGIEVLLLSWVLTLRYADERLQKLLAQEEALHKASETQEAQRQLNEQLEERVDERTFELEMALRELQEVNNELERKNSEDGLTGLFNRRHFDRQLTAEFRRAWRNSQPLALIMLDIDYFKPVNDTYGHMIGDQVLVAMAKRLKDTVRRPGDSVYRYGGEEFAVLLSNANDQEAVHVAEMIRRSIRETPFTTDAGPLSITVSIGVSVTANGFFDVPEQLLKTADDALYAAKTRGRDQLVIAPHLTDNE